LLVLGVLLLQLGFILSYVAAFHAPRPHGVPVAVVVPAAPAESARIAASLDSLPSRPLRASPVTSPAQARQQVVTAASSAALIVSPAGRVDTLLVASGGGTSVAEAVQQVITQAEGARHRAVTIADVVPLQAGDARGLTGFYLVIGWMVGGYLAASLVGVASGSRPANARRAVIRLASMVPYAIASGAGGAFIVGPLLGALTGHSMALWWLGALIVFASAAFSMAMQTLFGVVGIGIAVLIFVVVGNPSAGGAFQLRLLPPFWRAIGLVLPNGAGTDAVRRIAYFGATGITRDLCVIAAWAAAGTILTLAGSAWLSPAARARG
jgi:hypothetical protein